MCKLMQRFPKASRLLAEQEIHEFLNDANGYMARTSSPFYRGPREEDLKPPVGLFDKLLVVAWGELKDRCFSHGFRTFPFQNR